MPKKRTNNQLPRLLDELESEITQIIPDTNLQALPLQEALASAHPVSRAREYNQPELSWIATPPTHQLELSRTDDLITQAQRRNDELAALNDIIAAANRSLDLSNMLQEILERVLSATRFEAGMICLADQVSNQQQLVADLSLPSDLKYRFLEYGLVGTLSDLVYRSQEFVSSVDFMDMDSPDAGSLISLGYKVFLGVPLTSKGRVLGTVCIFGRAPQALEESTFAMMRAVSQQVGVAVENASLFAQTQSALEETEILYKASALLNASETCYDVLSTLRQYTVLGKDPGLISIVLFERPWLSEDPPAWYTQIAHWSLDSQVYDENLRFPTSGLLGKDRNKRFLDLVMIEHLEADDRLDPEIIHMYQDRYNAVSLLSIPFITAGRRIGLVLAVYPLKTTISDSEKRRLVSLIGQAAGAIQNIRLLDETRRRADQLQTAAEIARDTSSTLALSNLLDRCVELIRERFNHYHASIYLVDERGNQVSIRSSTGTGGEAMKQSGYKLTVGSKSVIGHVTAVGKSLVINDVSHHPIYLPNPHLPDTRAEIAIPLKVNEEVIGALDVQSKAINAFSNDDVSVLQILADQIAVAVENARAYELSIQAVDEMRKADQLKSQFLANMSHELRTPLNSIIGFSKVIMKGIDGPVNETQVQDLSAIYNSGQHLLNLINDILDLSKIEAGKMDLALEENVSVSEIIHSVVATTKGLIKDKPISLLLELADELPPVRADPVKIRQILINLLSNAAKFTDQGSIMICSSLEDSPFGAAEVLVRVIDTGPGIAPEDQTRLFLPFSQVDPSPRRKSSGTGLGLSICRHLVDMHQGRIGVESEIGRGSTFYFALPVALPAQVNAREELERVEAFSKPYDEARKA